MAVFLVAIPQQIKTLANYDRVVAELATESGASTSKIVPMRVAPVQQSAVTLTFAGGKGGIDEVKRCMGDRNQFEIATAVVSERITMLRSPNWPYSSPGFEGAAVMPSRQI
jgi:hypothetical protein